MRSLWHSLADQLQRSRWDTNLEKAELETMERLHARGFISDPKSEAKSVFLSEEGLKRSKELFTKHFSLNR